MPASIVHMIISKKSRANLRKDTTIDKSFLEFLEKYSTCMELGSIGPDIPYYESIIEGAIDLLFKGSDIPMGLDQWSYQLHSKEPNIFPLKMIEIIWKESDIEKEDWDDIDHRKFAFVCGYLSHMAADQIIHPLVNAIAGPYFKRGDAREKHRECEIYQDVYFFNEEYKERDFKKEKFNLWCDISPGWSDNAPIWFRYLIQKAFVEAHAIMPSEGSIEDWVDGVLTVLRLIDNFGPYVKAHERLKKGDDEKFQEYINLKLPDDASEDKKNDYNKVIGTKTYKDFFNDAVDLSVIYIKAAHKIYDSDQLNDELRDKFRKVVINADLRSPLEKKILLNAQEQLNRW